MKLPSFNLAPLIFIAGVVMGTGSAISAKVLYGLQAKGEDGEMSYFEKPLLLTAVMFVAMSLSLPIYLLVDFFTARQNNTDLLVADKTSWRSLFLFIVPTLFDLAATALSAAGLLFTTVSVYQLIRSSVMIFTALIKAALLGQKLKRYMWAGIGINTLATVIVSAVSFAPGHMDSQPGQHKDARLGVLLILLSCVVQSSQYVFEERLMKEDEHHPLLVIGMEGVWGCALMILIVFPWASTLPGADRGGTMENTYDAWIMIQNSTAIQSLLLVYFFSVFFFNIFAIYVTYLLSSVWHAILENFRPGSIWIFSLLLFYSLSDGRFGESWTAWSWLELAGMGIMLVGTAVFNGSLPVGCEYEEEKEGEKDSYLTETCITPVTGSPLVQRSLIRHPPGHSSLTHDSYSVISGAASDGEPDEEAGTLIITNDKSLNYQYRPNTNNNCDPMRIPTTVQQMQAVQKIIQDQNKNSISKPSSHSNGKSNSNKNETTDREADRADNRQNRQNNN